LDVSQDLQVGRDGREEALGCDRALAPGDHMDRAGHVDEVFLGSLAGMIGPRTGIRERVERGVESDQSDDFVAGLVGEVLEGDLADGSVAEVARGPGRGGCHDEGDGKREGDKMPEQVRVVEVQSAALLMSVRSSSKMAESSLNRCWRSIR